MKSKGELIAQSLYAHATPQKILDVGYVQHTNPNLKGEIYGIDIVEGQKPESYKEVKQVDLNFQPIPYPNGYFDAVTMGCVLAHVTNPLKLLSDINRVLKPGGVLVFSSPNPHYYWEVVLNVFHSFFKTRVSKGKLVEHFYEFSRYSAGTITDRAGFKMLAHYGCSFTIIKTGIKFNPYKFPGMAYEIIYVVQKEREPELFTTTDEGPGKGIKQLQTQFG